MRLKRFVWITLSCHDLILVIIAEVGQDLRGNLPR